MPPLTTSCHIVLQIITVAGVAPDRRWRRKGALPGLAVPLCRPRPGAAPPWWPAAPDR
jgi:hypothetical protein